MMKSSNSFVIVICCTKRKCSQIEPHFKVEIEDEAPWLSIHKKIEREEYFSKKNKPLGSRQHVIV